MLIIHVDGGLVQYVYSTKPEKDNSVIIVDTDTEGADDEDLTHALDDNGDDMTAFIHKETVVPLPENSEIHRFINSYNQK